MYFHGIPPHTAAYRMRQCIRHTPRVALPVLRIEIHVPPNPFARRIV